MKLLAPAQAPQIRLVDIHREPIVVGNGRKMSRGAPEIQGVPSVGGWRIEDFAADPMLKCKMGLVDESPNSASLVILMNQKQRPMSCALSITFDVRE